mmetsp:Transcript_102438/g.264885  ORF Transcript_102438/g.264885 Transcript_102438/m.264885 type:complete len:202 (-) Transcript_102438:172-777(-)
MLVAGADFTGEQLSCLRGKLEEVLVQERANVLGAQCLQMLPTELHRGGHLHGRLHGLLHEESRIGPTSCRRHRHQRNACRWLRKRCRWLDRGSTGRLLSLASELAHPLTQPDDVAARHPDVREVLVLDVQQGLHVVEAVGQQQLRVLQHVILSEERHDLVVIVKGWSHRMVLHKSPLRQRLANREAVVRCGAHALEASTRR